MNYAKFSPTGEVALPLWRALRRAKAPATVGELHKASNAHPAAIQVRLQRWRAAGFVDVLPPEPHRYEIAPAFASQIEAPSFGTLSSDAWTALRRLGRPATLEEIIAASGVADRPLYCRLLRWRRRGAIVKHEQLPRRYALSPAAPDVAEPPQVAPTGEVREQRPSARERMWRAMRILKRFDVPVLMMTAEAKRRSCEDFINLLSRGGYLRRLDTPAKRGPTLRVGTDERGRGLSAASQANLNFTRTWSTYQLVRNTGPKAPTITNPRGGERQLLDGNTGEAVTLKPLRRAREVNHGE
ncbi:MAG TPA: hypothetical protein VF605_11790 [Allosphingosinicella sp.]|jgi:hypothetical protein